MKARLAVTFLGCADAASVMAIDIEAFWQSTCKGSWMLKQLLSTSKNKYQHDQGANVAMPCMPAATSEICAFDMLSKMHAAYLVFRAAEQCAGASVEDSICGGARGWSLLGNLVVEVLDHNLVASLVQYSKAVPRYEDS